MTNFLISSKSQTSLITNTKCTLEKTWIVNTADIYAEPPQRQKNFRLKNFLFESFAFQKSKESQNFLFRHMPGFSALLGTLKLSNLSLCFILWHFMPFYLSMYLSFLCHFWYFLSIFFSVKPEMHLICLQGMSRDFGWMSLLSEGFTLGGI